MISRGSWRLASRVKTFDRLPRSLATVPKDLLDLLNDKNTLPSPVENALLSSKTEQKTDFLKLAVNKANTKQQLLEVIRKHGVIMSRVHLMLCWKRFTTMLEHGLEKAEVSQTQQGLQHLTDLTCARLDLFTANNFVDIIKLSTKLEFAGNSRLIDEICQAVRLKLKDLSLRDLIMLQFFLSRVSATSTHVEVMKLGIPVIFQTRVTTELDTKNSSLCYRALLLILSENMDQETCDVVGKAALNYCKEFSLAQAFNTLKCASGKEDLSVRNSEPIRQILSTCMDIVAQNKSELDQDDVETILRCCQTQRVGSKSLFEAFWSLAPSWPFELTVSLLKTSFKVNYLSLPAAELAMNLVLDNKNQHTEDIDVTRLAEAVALVFLHYDQNSEQALRAREAGHALADGRVKLDQIVETRPHLLAQLLLCFGVVGVFPNTYIDILFGEEFQRLVANNNTSYKFLVELEQCISLNLGRSSPYRALPEIKALFERDFAQSFLPRALTETLQIAHGGEQFLAKHVKTPLGAYADYMIAMRKGEYAIAHSNASSYPFERTKLQKLPSESKLVAILVEREQQDTFSYTGLRKLLFCLRERHLQAQNICTLVINLAQFESLPVHEKTPFVMKNLKDVLRDGCVYNSTENAGSKFSLKW